MSRRNQHSPWENQGRGSEECRAASQACLWGLWLLLKDAWLGLLILAVTFAVVVLESNR